MLWTLASEAAALFGAGLGRRRSKLSVHRCVCLCDGTLRHELRVQEAAASLAHADVVQQHGQLLIEQADCAHAGSRSTLRQAARGKGRRVLAKACERVAEEPVAQPVASNRHAVAHRELHAPSSRPPPEPRQVAADRGNLAGGRGTCADQRTHAVHRERLRELLPGVELASQVGALLVRDVSRLRQAVHANLCAVTDGKDVLLAPDAKEAVR
mmetsp:Transcript_61258/g.197391  ORF Transcript_61258/g.197391 Transcript_61258/m.197391 type:complete len:212 (+) Transcript_61258:298-933(+)